MEKVPSSQSQIQRPSVVKRQNVSLACTECRKKRIKCSGTTPCANCTAKGCPCLYGSDRRRKAHIIESFILQQALLYTVGQLRSENPDKVKSFILRIRGFQSNRDAETFLLCESRQGGQAV
ncbi:Fungal transcriptional regulatory protein, N-terminal [Penicillium camemberti]|uniref:Fungal transcriptional regulatory protein, N-terminal n=1 Tax=Penicillium camemberti (strain FM 013) TaxID=1429867 RepID=A0A0G4PGL4_PENC3|nr:Fungal transcriptional regulatory protein, N-terminal [Penicillium camemberti]